MDLSNLASETYNRYFNEGINKLSFGETEAQKSAIARTLHDLTNSFPDTETALIWELIKTAHIFRKSGAQLSPKEIANVVSASQSWNKASGHAFEEFCRKQVNRALITEGSFNRLFLQREIRTLVEDGSVTNTSVDLSDINIWLKNSTFDLFIVNQESNKLFGCVQAKTSIRDRVTRDREPSIIAMEKFFFSCAITLDGSFLKQNPAGRQKFIDMVNGGTDTFDKNGWHGMYVLSRSTGLDRIHITSELNFSPLVDHIDQAWEKWRDERQWLDHTWAP